MRLAEIVDIKRLGWLSFLVAAGITTALATHSGPIAAPPVVDVQVPIEVTVKVHDNVGDCASDVTTEGSRVFVHLREDPKTCAGVTRIYRVEGDQLIFEQELVDL